MKRTSVEEPIASKEDVEQEKVEEMPEEKIVETPKGEIKVKLDEKKVKFDEKKSETIKNEVVVPASAAETVEDPFCDEKNPRIITFQDVCQAAFMIKGGIDVTPCRVRNKNSSKRNFYE